MWFGAIFGGCGVAALLVGATLAVRQYSLHRVFTAIGGRVLVADYRERHARRTRRRPHRKGEVTP
jgi:hypothetical protein